MEAFSELSRRDIAQILRGLRKATRGDKQEIVITSGEILRDEELQIDVDLQDRMADTKVRTAISWLERADLLQRDENVTSVFQARPMVKDLDEARAKIAGLNLSPTEQSLWLAILREIFNTPPTESLTVDQLALLPEFANYAKAPNRDDERHREPKLLATQKEVRARWDARPPGDALAGRLSEASPPYRAAAPANPEFVSAKIFKILGSMTRAGLMKRDMLLSAFVRHKVADHSRLRLDRILATDRKLVDVLALEEPDPEGWMPLSLAAAESAALQRGLHLLHRDRAFLAQEPQRRRARLCGQQRQH